MGFLVVLFSPTHSFSYLSILRDTDLKDLQTFSVKGHVWSLLHFFLYNNFIEVQCTYYEIHPFKAYSSVVFTVFTNLEHFCPPKKKPCAHEQSLPIPLPAAPGNPTFCFHGFACCGHFT